MIARILRRFVSSAADILTPTAIALLFLTLIPYLHGFWWAFELPSHFRVHIAAISIAVAVFAYVVKSWKTSVLALITASICSTTVLTVPTNPPLDDIGITVVTQNLYLANENIEEATRVLIDEDPHVVVLQEYTPTWHEALKPVADLYLTRITVPQEGAFGIAIFSKLPISSYEILSLGDTSNPAIAVQIDAQQMKAHLVAVHLQPPMRRDWTKDRDRQLNELRDYLLALDGAYVVVGDFNNTPYSPSFRTFIEETRLRMGQPFWLPTWPSGLGWAGIPIDLVLGSEDVTIDSTLKIDSIGSDHRGLRFSISAQPE